MSLTRWLTGSQSNEESAEEQTEDQEPEQEVEEKPQAMVNMTTEQLQSLLNQQAEMFTSGLQQTVSQFVKPVNTEEEEKPLQAPSHEQIAAALAEAQESGDYSKYTQLQQQREGAIYQAGQREVQKEVKRLRTEGSNFIAQTNKQLIKQSVPDFDRYESEVEALASQLGLPQDTWTQPDVVALLTNTVRGRPENIEREFAERMEAQKRQANGTGQTADVGTAGRSLPSRGEEREPILSDEGKRALRSIGKTDDEFAKMMGYPDWATYERVADAVFSDDVVVHKWRKNAGAV